MGSLALGVGFTSAAQPYPVKSLRMIIPFAPGGGNDIIGRLASKELAERLGQQVVVDNRPGAGGSVGTEAAAKATPDGYTLLLGHMGTLALNPTLRPNLAYDPIKDFQPVSLIARTPNILVVNPSLPIKSAKDLIDLAKKSPDALTYGSGGVGSSGHVTAEYFRQQAKINILHVAYKGTGPSLVDLMGGQISMVFAGTAGIAPLVKSGRLRAIGVSTVARLPMFPEVPTIAESGLPGFEVTQWFGVVLPNGVPRGIVNRLHDVLQQSLQSANMRASLSAFEAIPEGSTPEQFRALIKSEISRWAVTLKDIK